MTMDPYGHLIDHALVGVGHAGGGALGASETNAGEAGGAEAGGRASDVG